MTQASIETTLELWASSLRDVKQRIRPLFTQERVAASAALFLDGLLGAEPRKTGWMRANTQARLARSPTARSVSLPPMSRARDMPSSTGPCTCPGTGQQTPNAWRTPMYQRASDSPPSPGWPRT